MARLGSRHGAPTLPDAVTVLAATRLTADADPRSHAHSGVVRSVHRAAIYVDLARTGELLVIAIDAVGGIPGGVLVDASDLRRTGIRAGMTVVSAETRWLVPAAGLAIETRNAAAWDPTLPTGTRLVAGPALAGRASVAHQVVTALATQGGLWPTNDGRIPDPWIGLAREAIEAMIAGLVDGDVPVAITRATDLIGLGIGLTPSGDDFLIGLLAGLEATEAASRAPLAAAIADVAPSRTTAIAAAALRHAADRRFSERLHDVVGALCQDDEPAIATAVAAGLAYGATSGSDTLAGLLIAVDVANAREAQARRATMVAA